MRKRLSSSKPAPLGEASVLVMSERERPGLKKSDEELGFVDLTVHDAKSLQRMDARGLCDAYISISLENRDGGIAARHKTKVVKQSLQPAWEEEFAFNVQTEDQIFNFRQVQLEDGRITHRFQCMPL